MSSATIFTILGTIPLFSMRTFLPAFLMALFLTYPEYFPGIENVPPATEESFITKNWVLIVLGILSILEIIADKSSSIRNFIKDAETYLKPLCFLLINLSILDEASEEVLRQVQWAAFNPGLILLAFGALAVHWLAKLRRDFITFLENVDEDDNFLIGKITSWLEDSLVLFGFLLLIWAGILMVGIYALGIAALLVIRKRFEKKLEQQKTTCPKCGEKNYPFAINCFNCKEVQPRVHKIGILGQRKNELITDIKKHQLNLISHRKCPNCGNKPESKKLFQKCNLCGTALFESPTVNDFLKYQDRKFYKLAGVSFLLGFIPVIGFVLSAVLGNIYLFSPYRRYISGKSSFFTKIMIKFIIFLLFILGVALGFIAAPVYIIMRYYVWRRKFVALGSEKELSHK